MARILVYVHVCAIQVIVWGVWMFALHVITHPHAQQRLPWYSTGKSAGVHTPGVLYGQVRRGYSRGTLWQVGRGTPGSIPGVLRSHLTSANPCSRLSVALMPRSSGNAQSCRRACMHVFACARAHAHATHAHTPTITYVYTRMHSGLCAGRSGTGRVPRKAVPASPSQATSRVFANA